MVHLPYKVSLENEVLDGVWPYSVPVLGVAEFDGEPNPGKEPVVLSPGTLQPQQFRVGGSQVQRLRLTPYTASWGKKRIKINNFYGKKGVCNGFPYGNKEDIVTVLL